MEFSDEEIKEELAVLGYRNVSSEILQQFKKDLFEYVKRSKETGDAILYNADTLNPSNSKRVQHTLLNKTDNSTCIVKSACSFHNSSEINKHSRKKKAQKKKLMRSNRNNSSDQMDKYVTKQGISYNIVADNGKTKQIGVCDSQKGKRKCNERLNRVETDNFNANGAMKSKPQNISFEENTKKYSTKPSTKAVGTAMMLGVRTSKENKQTLNNEHTLDNKDKPRIFLTDGPGSHNRQSCDCTMCMCRCSCQPPAMTICLSPQRPRHTHSTVNSKATWSPDLRRCFKHKCCPNECANIDWDFDETDTEMILSRYCADVTQRLKGQRPIMCGYPKMTKSTKVKAEPLTGAARIDKIYEGESGTVDRGCPYRSHPEAPGGQSEVQQTPWLPGRPSQVPASVGLSPGAGREAL